MQNGKLKTIRGKLKQVFAVLIRHDSLFKVGGEDVQKGRIQAKLGKTRKEVKNFFHQYKVQN